MDNIKSITNSKIKKINTLIINLYFFLYNFFYTIYMNFKLSIKVIVKKYILYTYVLSLFKTQILFAGSCKGNKQTTEESNSGKSALNSEEINAQEEFKLFMNTKYKNNSVEVPDYCQISDDKISLAKNGNDMDLSDTNFINKLRTLINVGEIKVLISNYYYEIQDKLCLVEQYKNKKLINRYLVQKNKLYEYKKELTEKGYKLQNDTKKNDTEEIKIYFLTKFYNLEHHENLNKFYSVLEHFKNSAQDLDIKNITDIHKLTKDKIAIINGNANIFQQIISNLQNQYDGTNCGNIDWFLILIAEINLYLKIVEKVNNKDLLCTFYGANWFDHGLFSFKLKYFISSLYNFYCTNNNLKNNIDAFSKKTSTEKFLYRYIVETYCR